MGSPLSRSIFRCFQCECRSTGSCRLGFRCRMPNRLTVAERKFYREGERSAVNKKEIITKWSDLTKASSEYLFNISWPRFKRFFFFASRSDGQIVMFNQAFGSAFVNLQPSGSRKRNVLPLLLLLLYFNNYYANVFSSLFHMPNFWARCLEEILILDIKPSQRRVYIVDQKSCGQFDLCVMD